MDPAGHHWLTSPVPGPHPQRPRERQDYHRPPYSHQGHGPGHHPQPQPPHRGTSSGHYAPPPPDPRERQRSQVGSSPVPRNKAYPTSALPPRPPPEFSPSCFSTPYSRRAYDQPCSTVGHSRPEALQPRPRSRQAYEYPPQGYWDYSQDYSYYDQGYYGGYYEHPGQWAPQNQQGLDQYLENTYEQDQSGRGYPEEHRYDQRRYSSQLEFRGYDEEHFRENGEVDTEGPCYAPGALANSKASGQSSSSYELSQYMNGDELNDPTSKPTWIVADTEHASVPQATAPLKYSLPHAVVNFGPAGQLIWVSPGPAIQGNPVKVEVHSLEIILGETQDQQDMRQFPGPLAREDLHKVDAISFALQRAEACMKDEKLQDKSSAALLWNLLVLLCRQNGRIVGSDIAELLMKNSQGCGDSRSPEGSEAATLIDLSEGPSPETDTLDGADLLTGTSSSISTADTREKDMQGYTKLLLAGRKKEALDSAMKSDLWGHALFLASKMDNRSYTTVLNRFTGQLAPSDPLQTLFQLLSGRIPAVSTSYLSEKWGDWKPHLAVMLSNETGDPVAHQKSIITMGDTLASRGLLHAAHICYLTAYAPFGTYTAKTERLVLLGNSQSLPFKEFAQNSGIRCTELFEYCQRLGDKSFSIPSFQVYKFLYACRLLDVGLPFQAYHYCEVIGMSLLRQQEPCLVLLGQLIKLAERLKQCEGMGQLGDTADSRSGRDPDWLQQLRLRQQCTLMENYSWTDTYQSPAEGNALTNEESRVYAESDTDDLSGKGDFQGPEAESLNHKGGGEQQQQHVQAQQINGLAPLSVRPPDTQPVVPLVAEDQDCSYHYTDTSQTQLQQHSSPQQPTLSCPTSNREGAEHSSGLGMTGIHFNSGMMAGDVQQSGQTYDYVGKLAWHQGGHRSTITQEGKALEPDQIQPKQSTKSGWFSSWFKPKPKEEQSVASLDDDSAEPVPTMEAPPTLCSFPPPPTINTLAANCPTQPTSAGINPFSRKAGPQLG
ncbi:protein transport protein Sec16B isoform X1 [Esox lucius]|uniref:protein transport protein Sec16B isoform X1 n=1 Tax=Esox lucius TaxID=8010 RepID=UPI00147722E9|nr:protein transport protein Sec16B isoform X1 [Esox lucius]XP_019904912.2 protein transport protein Sec16B isoform X1 [Esox lucius]